jgi:hypothetical protein
MRDRSAVVSRPWVKLVTVPIAVLAAYFVVPVDARRAPLGLPAGIILSVVALVWVAGVVFSEARSAQRHLNAWNLVVLLEITVVVFSFTYYLVATSDPTQFEGIGTRLDALYFSATTVSTVGFGDVHAAGQVARAIVTLHIAFNLVFVAAVINLGRDWMNKQRAAGARRPGESSELDD